MSNPAVPSLRLSLIAVALGLLVVACFDPLYAEPGVIRSWVVCCPNGTVSTCPCEDVGGCEVDLRPCASGACVAPATEQCSGADVQDAGQDGGGSSDGGSGSDGGSPSDGGSSDAGGSDAGPAEDGGVPSTDAGTDYALCCVSGHVTTCACPSSGCSDAGFVSCGAGSCSNDPQHRCP